MINTFPLPFIFLFLSAVILTECHKPPTVFIVSVIDSKTLQPVPEAELNFIFYETKDEPPLNTFQDTWVKTDAKGMFTYTMNGDYTVSLFYITKNRYLYKVGGVNYFYHANQGEENYLTVPLIPKDGKIVIKAYNDSGTTDKIYLDGNNPIQKSEMMGALKTTNYPFTVPTGGVYIDTIYVPTDTINYLYWSNKNNANLVSGKDSVFVSRLETKLVEIHY